MLRPWLQIKARRKIGNISVRRQNSLPYECTVLRAIFSGNIGLNNASAVVLNTGK